MHASDKTKRILLFTFGCIGVRLCLAQWLARSSGSALRWLGYGLGALGIGFATIYLLGLRKTGPEVFGSRIWWDSLRPVHAMLMLAASYVAVKGDGRTAGRLVAGDALLGAVATYAHHAGGLIAPARS